MAYTLRGDTLSLFGLFDGDTVRESFQRVTGG